VFRETLASQTLPIETSLRWPARHQLGLISLPPLNSTNPVKLCLTAGLSIQAVDGSLNCRRLFSFFRVVFTRANALCPDLTRISGSPSRDSLSENWAHVRESSRPRISCLSDLWLMCQRILLARSGRLSRDQPKNAVLPCKRSFCGTSSGQIAKISLRSGLFRFGRLNVPKHATGGYMSEMVSPAEQVNEEAKPFYA